MLQSKRNKKKGAIFGALSVHDKYMKRTIKIIFESHSASEVKKFGYLIDHETLKYKAVSFDEKYEPITVIEEQPVGNVQIFAQKLYRIIRHALEIPAGK